MKHDGVRKGPLPALCVAAALKSRIEIDPSALASLAPLPHIPIMHSDFSLFRERLAHACRARAMTPDRLCASIGLGSRRGVDLASSGLKALDVYRLAQIADRLEVSVDWLLGRSDAMDIQEKSRTASSSGINRAP